MREIQLAIASLGKAIQTENCTDKNFWIGASLQDLANALEKLNNLPE